MRRIWIGLLFAAGLAAEAFAQITPAYSFDPNDRPASGGLDSISPYNGQLSLSIPIGQTYHVGPGLSFQLRLNYSSKVWAPGAWALQGTPANPQPYMLVQGDVAIAPGWTMSLGKIVEAVAGVPAAYIGPDGSSHRLYAKRFWSDPSDPDAFYYTRDGSYLRVRYINSTSGYEMWSSNGNRSTFGKKVTGYDNPPGNYVTDYGRGRDGWHVTSIANTYDDAITVSYQTSEPWIPKDILIPAIDGTSVTNRQISVGMSGGRVSTLTVPVVNSGTAVYTLSYGTAIQTPRPVPYPTFSASLPHLIGIDLPNAPYDSDYTFSYYTTGGGAGGPSNSQTAYGAGALKTMTTPLGAAIEYEYGTWTFYHANILNRPGTAQCAYPPPPFGGRPEYKTGLDIEPNLPPIYDCQAPDRAGGVVSRRVTFPLYDSETKYYQFSMPNGESGAVLGAQTSSVVVSPLDGENQQHSTAYLFAASTNDGITGPLVGSLLRTSVHNGNVADSETDSPSPTNALRVTKYFYETDAFDPNPGSVDGTEANRRLDKVATIYSGSPADTSVSGKYHQVDYTFNATAGQYSKETDSGTIGGDARETETIWQPMISTSDWKLDIAGTLYLRATAGGAAFSTVQNAFDSNGYPTSSTITDGGAGAGTLVKSTPRDSHGFPSSETVTHGASTYTRTLKFKSGTLKESKWGSFTWFAVKNTVDLNTGLITESFDTADLKTTFTYDAFARPRITTPPGNDAVTTITYDSPTQATTVVADGPAEFGWSQTNTDSLGRTTKVRRKMPGGSIAKKLTRYDDQGNVIFESEWVPDGTTDSSAPGTTWSDFDHFGRFREIELADDKTSTVDYSAPSYPNSIWQKAVTIGDVSGSSSTTTHVYDAFGNILSVAEPAPVSASTSFTYNPQDRLIGASQGPQTRTLTWDAFGFLRKEKIPERQNQESTYTYDALGNVKTESHPGTSTTTRTYDGAGRPLTAAGAQTLVRFCYDGDSSCLAVNDTGGLYPQGKLTGRIGYNPTPTPAVEIREAFFYDDRGGRLSSKTTEISNSALPAQTESWIYDKAGEVVVYGHPRGAAEVFNESTTWSYGYPTAVRANGLPVLLSATYHPSGMLASYVTGDGSGDPNVPRVTTTIQQAANSMARPSRISTAGAVTGTTPDNFDTGAITYDGAGNITAMGSDSFVYDRLSRLTSATLQGFTGAQGFGYDRYGNLTSITTHHARTFTVSTSTNRITATTPPTSPITYTAGGNIDQFGTEDYTWDDLDRMIRYVVTGGTDWRYLYDGASERIVKIPASRAPADYIWTLRDQHGRIATEYQGTVVSRDNIYLGNLLVASYSSCLVNGPPGWTFYSSDHLGTPRLMTDGLGQVLDLRKYWPYGQEASFRQSPSAQRLRFAGMERDGEANRFYAHARSYDFAAVGRFLTIDSNPGNVADPQSLNRYAYALSNPIRFTDPTGLAPGEVTGTITGFVPGTNEQITLGFSVPAGDPRDFGTVMSGVFQASEVLLDADYVVATTEVCYCQLNINLEGGEAIANGLDSAFTVVGPMAAMTAAFLEWVYIPEVRIARATRAARRAAANYRVGTAADDFLRTLYGGSTRKRITTPGSFRVVDNFAQGVARESKVGRTSLTKRVRDEIQKDIWLRSNPGLSGVRSVEWVFRPSKTGWGPTAPLRKMLTDNGIPIVMIP